LPGTAVFEEIGPIAFAVRAELALDCRQPDWPFAKAVQGSHQRRPPLVKPLERSENEQFMLTSFQ
jgi:hypothetical protein